MLLEYTVPSDRAAINRANSLQSTGPKTEAGKQKSSLNALRHGLTGQTVVLPTEDLTAFESFTKTFQDEFQPIGALENHLVQSLCSQAWRLNRAEALENNLLTLGVLEKSDSIGSGNAEVQDALAMAAALAQKAGALSTLSMHQNRIARTFERTLTQLRQLQAERREKEKQDLEMARRLYQLHREENKESEQPEPYNPAADGFAFTIVQIEQYMDREVRNRIANKDHYFAESAS
jgi:chromosome segregation ATPase